MHLSILRCSLRTSTTVPASATNDMPIPATRDTLAVGRYTFAGLEYDELPVQASCYLDSVVRVTNPLQASAAFVDDERTKLFWALWCALEGDDAESSIKRMHYLMDDSGRHEKIRQQFLADIPEHAAIMSEFTAKFDALVWLQMERRRMRHELSVEEVCTTCGGPCTMDEAVGLELSVEEQCAFRNAACSLDEAVERTARQLEVYIEEKNSMNRSLLTCADSDSDSPATERRGRAQGSLHGSQRALHKRYNRESPNDRPKGRLEAKVRLGSTRLDS